MITQHSQSPADNSPGSALPAAESTLQPTRAGKVRPAILLWALGVPIPLILLFLLIRSCVG